MSSAVYAPTEVARARGRQLALLDLLDRLLAGGVVIEGQIMLAVADIDLVEIDLALMLSSIDKAAGR